MKHTEDWHIEEWAGAFAVLRGTEMVCESFTKADARLIAKAPEMAALLRKHLGWHRASGMPTQETEALLAELEDRS